MRRLVQALSVAACVLLTTGSAQAQARRYNPITDRPATSPYLNLFRSDGSDPAFNYHRFVRPELEFRAAGTQQRRSLLELQDRIAAGAFAGPTYLPDDRPTLGGGGHRTYFMNTMGYFSGGASTARQTLNVPRRARPPASRSAPRTPRMRTQPSVPGR